jgi:hypothetical protein
MSEYKLAALQTLEEERCALEGMLLYKSGEAYVVVALGCFDGTPLSANMDIALNVEHKKLLSEVLSPLQNESPVLNSDPEILYFLIHQNAF